MKAKQCLNDAGYNEFEQCEITMLPNDEVVFTGDEARKFNDLLDLLDEVEDVQNVYHNAKIEE